MELQHLLADDEAVSPVIGVILMVAITVILAAVIGTFVLGLGDQVSSTAPTASFTFDFEDDSTTQGNDKLTITHDGGDTIDAKQLRLKNSAGYDQTSGTTSDSTSYTDATFNTLGGSSDVTAGTSVVVYADEGGANTDGFNDDTVRVTWQSSNGEDTATLGKWTGPNA